MVGKTGGDFAHDWAFGFVAVAAATEKGDYAALCGLAHGVDYFFQPVGGMCVVYENGIIALVRHGLNTPGYAL